MKNVEFCHALWKFCTYTTINSLKSSDFIAWMKSHQKAYPDLYGWLTHHKMIVPGQDSRYQAILGELFTEAA